MMVQNVINAMILHQSLLVEQNKLAISLMLLYLSIFVLMHCIVLLPILHRVLCTVTCTNLTLSNGGITYSPTSSPRIENGTATHICNNGYVLSGGTVRTCQSDRTWSGGNITCNRKWLF